MNTRLLSAQAVHAAAQLRAQHQIGPAQAICPYDLAIELQIKVSFLAAPSLEGMYSPEPRPAIILNSERPAGRRRFTCAHEIGHHIFKHGYRIDELSEENSSSTSPDEFLAQRFASALLMPKIAIDAAFSRRGWSPSAVQPDQFFIVAQELGVGFATLVTNTEVNLKAISAVQAEALRRIPLPKIRNKVVGRQVENDVFKVDAHWLRRTVDVAVGDLVILPEQATFTGACALQDRAHDGNLIAMSVGTGTIYLAQRLEPLTLRVSEEGFVGLARYRHLEDSADDEL